VEVASALPNGTATTLHPNTTEDTAWESAGDTASATLIRANPDLQPFDNSSAANITTMSITGTKFYF
jgi:hypothetical protein